MYEFVWFLGGALTYKILSKLLGIGQITIVFQSLQYSVLKLLATVAEDVSYIKALKHKTMMESNLDQSIINNNKIEDIRFFDEWKDNCISNIHSSVPSYIKLSFENWKEGMDLLTEYYRSRLNEKEK